MLGTTAAVAACGGSGAPRSTSSNTGASIRAPGRSSGLKLAECMRAHGVSNYPDPSANGGGTQIKQSSSASGGANRIVVDGVQLDAGAPTFQRAMNACQKYQPQGPPISGAQLARIRQGALKMAQCMRTHGVPNFSDPQVTSGPGGHGIAVRLGLGSVSGSGPKGSPPSPAFQRAMRTCQSYMRVGLKASQGTR
ncbi:MAG: hypothetical protein KGL16_01020 [Acidobacteriota bacterium]|nr:hypothetical protein [Acidobacteriota bacterium]